VAVAEDFDRRRKRYALDPGGRVIETVKPDGARLVYGYDKTDRVTRIESFAPGAGPGDQPQDVQRFWYDARGLLEKAENSSSLVEYRRDKNGAIVAEALNGRWVESKRDAMGRRIERRIGDGLVAYAHDPLGLVAKIAIGDQCAAFFHARCDGPRDAPGQWRRLQAGFNLRHRRPTHQADRRLRQRLLRAWRRRGDGGAGGGLCAGRGRADPSPSAARISVVLSALWRPAC
jgi:YD repeat-containing protein